MSFDLRQLLQLQQSRSAEWEHYQVLVAAADCSAYGSIAAEAKAAFERDWSENATAVQRRLGAAAVEAAEAAARAAG